jgi:uncharacterized protein
MTYSRGKWTKCRLPAVPHMERLLYFIVSISKHWLAPGTSFNTPYYVIKGNSKGPTFMITAGIHGSEIASILAAQKLTNIQIKRGTIILVPIVNMRAFHRRIRGVPDVNRTFPSTPNDAARGLLAKNLFRLARHSRPKWVLDLHEAIGFSKIDPRKLGQSILTNPRSMAVSTAKRVINHINHSIQKNPGNLLFIFGKNQEHFGQLQHAYWALEL